MGSGSYRRDHPIWSIMETQGRTLKWLARKCDYSYQHVLDVKTGSQAASPAFRRRCAEALDIAQDVLFKADGAPLVEVRESDGAEIAADPLAVGG